MIFSLEVPAYELLGTLRFQHFDAGTLHCHRFQLAGTLINRSEVPASKDRGLEAVLASYGGDTFAQKFHVVGTLKAHQKEN